MGRRGRLRYLLFAVAAVAAVAMSGPMLPLELAVWFSGELLLYLEVASGVWLTSRATNLKALSLWLKSKADRMRASRTAWPGSHPRLTSWIQATLAFQ